VETKGKGEEKGKRRKGQEKGEREEKGKESGEG